MKVREERERYQDMAQTQEDTFSVVPPFAINDRFELSKEFACYALSIELVIPIDYIVLQVYFLETSYNRLATKNK